MFDLDKHERFGEGIYRAIAANNPEYPNGALWELTNMVYNRSSEDPEKMKGYTQLGSTAMGDGSDLVTGLFDYDEGTRLVATCTDGTIYEYAGSDWAASSGGTGFSTSDTVRWSGAMAYGAVNANDMLILCNGVNAPQKYYVNAGNEVSGLGAGGEVPPATGRYPVSWGGRYWMADATYPDTLYYSATNDCEKWTTGGGSIQIDRGSGAITGLYVFAGNLLIFKRRKILRLLPGTSVESQSVREVSSRIGTPSHWTIKEVGANESGVLIFLSDTGPQAMVPTSSTGGFYVKNIADGIKPYLTRMNTAKLGLAWADFNEDRGEYYLQYVTGTEDSPDEGLIANVSREVKRPRWTYHNMQDKTAGTIYRSSGAEVQVMGDSAGKVWKLHDGHSRDGAGYYGRVMTQAYAQGERGRMKKYGRTFVDLETYGDYRVDVRLNMGRSALPGTAGNPLSVSDVGALDGWGVGLWGVAKWGGSANTGKYVRPETVARGAYERIVFETSGADMWFKLNGLAIEYALKRRMLAA